MTQKDKIKMSSNRNFGLVFFAIFFILSLWPLVHNDSIKIWSIIISLIFLILGLLNSKILTPLNKLWHKFGIILGSIVSPIIMGIIFFAVVTPTGLLMRIINKDLLNKKYNKKKKTYWIECNKPLNTMKKQF